MLLPVRSRLAKTRDILRYSLWFIPAALLTLAIALGLVLPLVDANGAVPAPGVNGDFWGRVVPDSAGAVRQVLRLVAGSMITVATTAFSITIVALQLASSQLGPRLLRNFVRDRTNQVVFGTLIGTFGYCVTVVLQLPAEPAPVPGVSFLGAVALTGLSVVLFIVFIHHTAGSVQTDAVIADVSRELDFSLDRLFPMTIGYPPPVTFAGDDGASAQPFPGSARLDWSDATPVVMGTSGYIQAIDGRFLVALAERYDLVIRLERRPGDFVERGSVVALVSGDDAAPNRRRRRVAEVFIVGNQRTQQQDVAFVFHQLVEIALRALSPGINDSFTAMRCIDRLTDAMIHVGENAFPSPYRYGPRGDLRVIAAPLSFSVLLSIVFSPIAESAVDRSIVVLHLFGAFRRIARRTSQEESRKALAGIAEYLFALAQTSSAYPATGVRVRAAYEDVRRTLEGHSVRGETP